MRYFATYLIYVAVIARAIGWNQDAFPIPTAIWLLLAVFGIILFSERLLTQRFPLYPRLYTVIQSSLVISMLYSAPKIDFLTMLFFPLSFQAVQFFPGTVGFVWIGIYSLAMAGMFLFGMELQAGVTMILAGSGSNMLMGSFAHLIGRTEQRRLENQHLFGDLQQAYRQLHDSASQAEALAAATERHRLVRELHDSLTQTLFSMNLAVQAAQLAALETPQQAKEHLAHLQSLSRSAAGEVQALTGLAPQRSLVKGGLAEAIEKLVEERLVRDGLQVTLKISGQRKLPEAVDACLYRIVQEALNNITRHSGVRQATVWLRLDSPTASVEVDDKGCGFELGDGRYLNGFGLVGMAERAKEIGWKLEVKSDPGQGTHIHVEEKTP